ncbi:ER-to-golgi transport membrane protein [Kalaharituber pfeilii]|nr:ER-to-golgi transport membrane protein [Kalaharituber pfeilii]
MIFSLFKVIILIINGIAILSEDRFLARIGWSALPPPQPHPHDPYSAHMAQMQMGQMSDPNSIKAKLINLISAVRVLMRIPLIGLNTLVILYELILG